YQAIDKIPIRVKDAPGFAVNRFFVPWLNEATRLLEEGLGTIPDIDRIACDVFGIGMGPFALMNATGVPIAEHAASGLASRLGKFYAPSVALRTQVSSKAQWDLADATVRGPSGRQNEAEIKERLVAAAIGIAAQLVTEGVTDAASVDLGARVGLRWNAGPFELAQTKLGLPNVEQAAQKLFSKWDLPVARLSQPLEWIESRVIGQDGHLIFNIPDRMNPLSPASVAELGHKFDGLSRNPEIRRIFFSGRGKAFVAGADIKFFLDAIATKDWRKIRSFTEEGQWIFSAIAESPKPTIAFLNGLTLGGGLELALACQYRIATPRALLAFPETGIGIYPGLGGTQRALRHLGKGLAKYLIATGSPVNAETAKNYGLVDTLVDPDTTLAELGEKPFSIARDRFPKPSPSNEGQAFETFDGSDFSAPELGPHLKILKRKAPLALQIAMRLIDQGSTVTLAEGLKLELSHLDRIFSTEDARTGLESVLNRSRPEFKGK
ncbi:MAG: enoyl-CoA hydratase/isomerase family protein, partial [Bdellovibrionota bacterium]